MSLGVNLQAMIRYFSVLLVLAVLITAGCVEPETANATVTATTAPALVTSSVPTNTPVLTPTPVPEQMAYLTDIQCAEGDKTGAAYHCYGNVRIQSGSYDEVQVIAIFPDNNTFKSGTVAMGGNDIVLKPFYIFPDLKYEGQEPKYFVRLDNNVYPVVWSGTTGTAWSNLPS